MRYKVLKDFKGSPDGRFAVDYAKGEVVPLTKSLAAVALEEKWVRKATKKDLGAVEPEPMFKDEQSENISEQPPA